MLIASVAPADWPARTIAGRVEVLLGGVRDGPGRGGRDVAPLPLADGRRGRQAVLDADDGVAPVGEPAVERGAVVALAAHPAAAVHPHDDRVRAGAGGAVEVEVQRPAELVDPVLLGAVRAPVGLAGDGERGPPVDVGPLGAGGAGLVDEDGAEPDRRDEGERADDDPGARGAQRPGQPAEPDAGERRQRGVQGVLAGDERPEEPDHRQPRGVGADGDEQHRGEPDHADHAHQPHAAPGALLARARPRSPHHPRRPLSQRTFCSLRLRARGLR